MPHNVDGQKTFSIYAGDIQLRTPQDQGPVQNAAVDKGAIPVSIRHLYNDATAVSYFVNLVETAYNELIKPNLQNESQFTGITGMGDYFDLGCEQERSLFMIGVEQMILKNPQLRFNLLARGNHDGGQYMGTVWSTQNFYGIVGLLYPDLILDAQMGACGDADYMLESHESVELFDSIVRRQKGEDVEIQEVLSEVQKGSRRKFQSDDQKYKFKTDDQKIFDLVWKKTDSLNRWDAVIHYNKEPFDFHDDDGNSNHVHDDHHHDHDHKNRHDRKRKIKEFSHNEGDVQQWMHLQAFQEAEFQTSDPDVTVPVYKIALDTQDFSSFNKTHSSVFGHISKLQIAYVENFINTKLAENPHAKFKLVMHYPIDDLVCRARKAFKRLLSNDAIILVADAHVHARGWDWDLGDDFRLKRETPLPRLSVPSTTDETREVVVEEMSFHEDGGKYKIGLKFIFKSLLEVEIANKTKNPEVYETLQELEQSLIAKKLEYHEKLKEEGYKVDWLTNDSGEPNTTYLNEDEVIAQISNPFIKNIANGQANRKMQVGNALSLIWRLGKFVAPTLTTKVSIEQMRLDFEGFIIFLDLIGSLFEEEHRDNFPSRIQEFYDRLHDMKTYYQIWLQDYTRRKEGGYPTSGLRIYNNLYTSSNMQYMYEFINRQLPEGSWAKSFAMVAGLRASKEEARVHDYPNAAETGVDNVIHSTAEFSF